MDDAGGRRPCLSSCGGHDNFSLWSSWPRQFTSASGAEMFPFHRQNTEAARKQQLRRLPQGSSGLLQLPQQKEGTERSRVRARAGGQDLKFSGHAPGLLPLGFETPPTSGFPPTSQASSSPLPPAHPPGDSPAAPPPPRPVRGAATSPETHSLSRVLTSCPGTASRALPLSRGASGSSLCMLFPLPVTLFPSGALSCHVLPT